MAGISCLLFFFLFPVRTQTHAVMCCVVCHSPPSRPVPAIPTFHPDSPPHIPHPHTSTSRIPPSPPSPQHPLPTPIHTADHIRSGDARKRGPHACTIVPPQSAVCNPCVQAILHHVAPQNGGRGMQRARKRCPTPMCGSSTPERRSAAAHAEWDSGVVGEKERGACCAGVAGAALGWDRTGLEDMLCCRMLRDTADTIRMGSVRHVRLWCWVSTVVGWARQRGGRGVRAGSDCVGPGSGLDWMLCNEVLCNALPCVVVLWNR